MSFGDITFILFLGLFLPCITVLGGIIGWKVGSWLTGLGK
jgi:hypothetical protein